MNPEQTYIIPCFFKPPIPAYHRELVDLFAERFGLTFTQRQAIPAHFTLKYHFTTPDSAAARRILDALIATLRTLPWMSWDRYDAGNLHPHMTIAEQCRPRFRELWALLPSHERRFTGSLDNITILRKVGETDGTDPWAVHRSFELGV